MPGPTELDERADLPEVTANWGPAGAPGKAFLGAPGLLWGRQK